MESHQLVELLQGLGDEALLHEPVAVGHGAHGIPLGTATQLALELTGLGQHVALASGPLPTEKGALQQEDRLHATRLGVAFLGHELQPVLKRLLPKAHALRQSEWQFEDFVEAAGAEGELEVLVDAAKAKANAAGGK